MYRSNQTVLLSLLARILDGKLHKDSKRCSIALLKPNYERWLEILWLKVPGVLKKRQEHPLKYQKKLMSSKNKQNRRALTFSSPCTYEVDQTGHFLTKKQKIETFVVKSPLETNCKRFGNTAIRKKVNLKPDRQMETTQSNERRSYVQ